MSAFYASSHVVVAIHIGGRTSSFFVSFSLRLDETRPKWGVPTVLLLKPDQTFHSFGYEAMNYYKRLSEDEKTRWYYFEKFKLTLYTEKIVSRQTTVQAANGREMPILSVFTFALTYFKDEAIRCIMSQSRQEMHNSAFKWVVTVPAKWEKGAKPMMRAAAYEAGLAPDKLKIVSEPDAASLYCGFVMRYDKEKISITGAIRPGMNFVLADLGDDAINLTVYQVQGNGRLKRLVHVPGEAWVGSYVNEYVAELLEKIFGKYTIEKYKTEYPDNWNGLLCHGATRLKLVSRPYCQISIKFPYSFRAFVWERGSSVEAAIAETGNANLTFARGALFINYPEIRKLFDPLFHYIANSIEATLREVGPLDYMILIGSFMECNLLETYLRHRFRNFPIAVPTQPSLAFLMGAVLVGHELFGCRGIPELSDDQSQALEALFLQMKEVKGKLIYLKEEAKAIYETVKSDVHAKAKKIAHVANHILQMSSDDVETTGNRDCSFPADDEEVSQDLIRACAFVKPSKWDEFGLSLGVSLADINEIGESTNSHISRMFRVLESWRLAKWPTVGQLLAKFETFRVNRQAIESEFKKLQ
ncbi:heat shock 70 kDa protein 12A-like isoform X2 [Oscarella lobularis]